MWSVGSQGRKVGTAAVTHDCMHSLRLLSIAADAGHRLVQSQRLPTPASPSLPPSLTLRMMLFSSSSLRLLPASWRSTISMSSSEMAPSPAQQGRGQAGRGEMVGTERSV